MRGASATKNDLLHKHVKTMCTHPSLPLCWDWREIVFALFAGDFAFYYCRLYLLLLEFTVEGIMIRHVSLLICSRSGMGPMGFEQHTRSTLPLPEHNYDS